MVPMFTCGLVRSNFALATVGPPVGCYLTRNGCGAAEGTDDHSPRTFLMISSAMFVGTSAYESNSIEYEAWPEVLDLRSPTYPNISDSGTSALTTISPKRSSCA